MNTGNREYKNDVFVMLMEYQENALSLYNAVNDSDYTDPELVEICTLERGVSLTVNNDASFVFDLQQLNLYEHQASVCPNMPLRLLLYFTDVIERLLKTRKNLYGPKLVKIPTPHFVVFYNGEKNRPERYDLRLSDAFEKQDGQPELELTCSVYNINRGHNEALLGKCKWLREYALFVGCVRDYYQDSKKIRTAVRQAVDYCIENDILKDFLLERREEVEKVVQLDYTFERQLELEREDSLEEGREEGRKEGRIEGSVIKMISQVCQNLQRGKSVAEMAYWLAEPEEVIQRICDIAQSYAPDYDVEKIYADYCEDAGVVSV